MPRPLCHAASVNDGYLPRPVTLTLVAEVIGAANLAVYLFLLLTIKSKTIQINLYILIIIICFNNDNGLVKVCFPYRRCHQVKYTVAMSERSLKTFLKIDSRQRSLVSSLYFHTLYLFAKEFVRNDQDFIRFLFVKKQNKKQ